MPLSATWKHDAAGAYLDALQANGLNLELVGDRLRIPGGHTPAEVELVRLLKPELIERLERDALHIAAKAQAPPTKTRGSA